MDLMQFGNKIKSFRKKNKLTQQELADKLKISRTSLSYYEQGNTEPNIYTLLKLSEIMDCSIDYLLSNKPNIRTQLDYTSNSNSFNDYITDIKSLKKLLKKVNRTLVELEASKKKTDLIYTELKRTINRISYTEDIFNSVSSELISLIKTLENKANNNLDKNITEEYAAELAPDVIDLNDYKKEIVYREIPDYGYIPAGKLSVTYEDDVEFISIPEHNLCSYKDYYILHISGDSMNKLFDDGEAILVEETSDVFPNDIVVARIDDKATVKKLANTSECINLIPLSTNPNHKIQVIKSEDIVFQGRVCGKLSDYL